MKSGNIIAKKLLHAGVAAAAVFACSYQPVIAEESKDISTEIAALRNTIVSAEVYLVRRDSTFNHDFDEHDAARAGCRYAARATSDVNGLIDVISNSQLEQVPAEKEGYDARIVVRLHQNSSRYSTLVLSADSIDAPARGEFRRDGRTPGTSISVEAKHGIENALRAWAAQHESLATKRCHQ
jgi:hypothetical protein